MATIYPEQTSSTKLKINKAIVFLVLLLFFVLVILGTMKFGFNHDSITIEKPTCKLLYDDNADKYAKCGEQIFQIETFKYSEKNNQS